MLSRLCPVIGVFLGGSLIGCASAQNDDCAGAIMVHNGANGLYSNAGSTTSAPAWPCVAGGNDVWFLYVTPAAGTVVIDTCTALYDTVLQVFTGGCGNLTSLACNDDSCGLQSSVTVNVPACTPLYIRVGGYFGATGTFPLHIAGPVGSPCPGGATTANQGAGCPRQFTSFYELFGSAAAFDLGGNSLTMINVGTGYVVTVGGGTYNAVGSLSAPTTLALSDDSSIAAGTLGLVVGSNGWVALGPGNSTAYLPSTATLLSNPSTAFYSWHDMNPALAGSGLVKYEQSGTQAQITFDGVWDFGGTTVADANHIQFQVNTATGNVTICWGTMSTLGASGTGHLVGYSPGGPSSDPGNTDLSTVGVIVTSLADTTPLALTVAGRPVQGVAPLVYNATTNNIPPSALLHVGIVGIARPGLPLAVIGAPGCTLSASLDILIGPVALPSASVTWTAITLPALPPSFAGFEFNLQGAILGTPINSALGTGVLTSNGIKCTVGTF